MTGRPYALRLTAKPANVSHVEAAAVPVSGMTALQGLRDGGVAAGAPVGKVVVIVTQG